MYPVEDAIVFQFVEEAVVRNFVKCFLDREGWRLSVFYYRYCVRDCPVERCFLNPCCASWRMLCESRCCMILLVIMCSSILQVMDVSDIGR